MKDSSRRSVYLSAAVSSKDQGQAEIVRQIVKYLNQDLAMDVLGEHQPGRDANKYEELGCRQNLHTATQIERGCRLEIKRADFFVAEFSVEDTGVGREIEMARQLAKNNGQPAKLLCLFQVNSDHASSKIIGLNPAYYHNVVIYGYCNWTDLKDYLANFFAKRCKKDTPRCE